MNERRPLLSLRLVAGPADLAWARETLEKARINTARSVAWYCMLATILKLNGNWRPPTTLVEGPRRCIA